MEHVDYLTAPEAAAILGVHPRSVSRPHRDGQIAAVTIPRFGRLYRRDEVVMRARLRREQQAAKAAKKANKS